MSVIDLVWQKTQSLLRMEVVKTDPVGSGAVSAYKERQEVFRNLYNEIA